MYILSLNMWFQKLMRQFFFAIDKIVYNFISDIYDLLISIARTSVLTQADIIDMADRIYKLLAVFMVFKVTFSLIMYVVNPDDFSDKSKGVSKLITNIGMSLSLLILTPYIFNYAYQLQTIVLEDNSLAALVFGDDANVDESHFSTAGDDMAYITISPFFSPNLSLPSLYVCSDLSVNKDGERKFNDECKNAMEKLLDDDDEQNTGFDSVVLNNYITGFELKSLGLMYRQDMAIATTTKANKGAEEFVMDYKYIFSTVVGIVIVLLLLSFCMDVAVRSIKLAFLQLVAPIPIISIVDPKSGKDGLFKKWYQMCFKTYLSLFIRLLALYFAVYIIGRVADMKMVDIVDGSYVSNGFISIFIIIGALMFAKQLPKLLEGLGIKLDSNSKFTLNPIKKFEKDAIGGKKLLGLGAVGAAAGLAGGVNMGSRLGQGLFNKENWLNKNGKFTAGSAFGNVFKTAGRSVSSGVAGTTSALYRGSQKVMKGEKAGKVFSNSYGEAMFSKIKREDRNRRAGVDTLGEKIGFAASSLKADFMRYTGNLNAGQKEYLTAAEQDSQIKAMQDNILSYKVDQTNLKKQKFEAYENAQAIGKNIDQLLENDSKVKAAKAAWKNAPSKGLSEEEIENLRQNYKYVKAQVLQQKDLDVNSVIHEQVQLYNDIRKDMDSEQRAIFTELDTNIRSVAQIGDKKYDIKVDDNGLNYYESNGNRIYEDTWGENVKRKLVTGVTIMGDNDDRVAEQKVRFETSKEYTDLSDNIKNLEQQIEATKSSSAYKEAHDENSRAKIANNSRINNETQKPGFKPSARPMDSKATDNSYYSNLGGPGPQDGPNSGHSRHRGRR